MRLFIGVWLTPELNAAAAELIARLGKDSAGWKWTDPANLHFTLRFLGETPPERIGALSERLEAAAAGCRRFTLGLGRSGTFPPRGPARILWLGAEPGAAELTELAGRVESACQDYGFPAEPKPFKPHLTIARAKDETPRPAAFPELRPPGLMEVGGFALIESKLQPRGPVYETVRQFGF